MRKHKKIVVAFAVCVITFCIMQSLGYARVQKEKETTTTTMPATELLSLKEEEALVTDVAPADTIYVEYIDVGQGDSTLIYDESTNYSILIDTGLYEAYDNVQATLSEYGIESLDMLILTHPDTDHIQSAVDVLEDYDSPVVCISRAVNPDTKAYEYLTEYLLNYSEDIIYPSAGDRVSLGGGSANIMFLNPACTDPYDTNGNSLIVKLQNGGDELLFLGDATGDEIDKVMTAGYDLSADVLKASHHGSANDGCNSKELFNAVDPEYLLVSCGYQNDYGHPHIETMELCKEFGLKLYRTDLQGSVSCKSTGDGLTWSTEPTELYTNGNGF